MDQEQAIKILKPLMWKIGKSNGEQLWMHQFTAWHVFTRMMDIGAFPRMEKEKQDILEVSCLLHDLKKSTPWNQMILLGETDTNKILTTYQYWWENQGITIKERELSILNKRFENAKTDHQIETDRDLKYFLNPYLTTVEQDLPFGLTERRTRDIFDLIKHHFLKEDDISQSEQPGFGNYLNILKLCDRLASMESIDVNTIMQLKNINLIGRQIFDVTYFTISRDFGPFTALVSDVLFQNYKNNDWTPLLYHEEGGVLVTGGKGNIPDKERIVEEVYQTFVLRVLNAIPVQYGTKNNFVGMAADHPQKFMLSHKEEIIRKLNESDTGITFFKLLTEVLDNDGYKTKPVRDENPVLDVLFGLSSGTTGIGKAGNKWNEKYKEKLLPLKEDGSGIEKRGSLNYIFNSVGISDVIPDLLLKDLEITSTPLKKVSSHQLFDILSNIAGLFKRNAEREEKIKTYIDEIISMEEEKDFQEIALQRFAAYKSYKQKPTDEKTGICEICGCPIPQKPGADFAKGQIQAFSQIKARSDIPRKICPFCAYDNSIMRQGTGNWVPVYAKIFSKIPMAFRKEITDIIKQLKDGIIRIQNIENMENRWGILFPQSTFPLDQAISMLLNM